MLVAPSILSADFACLKKEIRSVKKADYIHIDVMDGHFVPNLTIGPIVINSIRKISKQVFDVHLMISNPQQYAKQFIDAGANSLTFHYEALMQSQELISYIKSRNVNVGISIKPDTDIAVLEPYLDKIDLVLIMSVEPGFGGQSFLLTALDKIRYLKKIRTERELKFLIEVDGGINFETAKNVAEAGCDIIVAGTYIFKQKNRHKIIKELKKL